MVTGSNGLLGQTLISLLSSKKGVKLIATSKGANRYLDTAGYEYAELDLCDSTAVTNVLDTYLPDVIIHTAAITNVDTCHIERDLCRKLNIHAVEDLVKLCEKQNIHFIHLSTDFVFDGQNGPYLETDEPKPVSFYGESKYEAEKLIQASACKWAIIRTILVYGVTANMSRSNIVLWAKSALEKGEFINVVNDQWRMPTLVQDLAEACWLIAEQGANGVFHVSGREMMTICDLVYKVADFWKLDKTLIVPINSASLNQEAKRPAKTGFILDKAMNVLGYRPHSFVDGLKLVDKQLLG